MKLSLSLTLIAIATQSTSAFTPGANVNVNGRVNIALNGMLKDDDVVSTLDRQVSQSAKETSVCPMLPIPYHLCISN